jgi:hypothetical protein
MNDVEEIKIALTKIAKMLSNFCKGDRIAVPPYFGLITAITGIPGRVYLP